MYWEAETFDGDLLTQFDSRFLEVKDRIKKISFVESKNNVMESKINLKTGLVDISRLDLNILGNIGRDIVLKYNNERRTFYICKEDLLLLENIYIKEEDLNSFGVSVYGEFFFLGNIFKFSFKKEDGVTLKKSNIDLIQIRSGYADVMLHNSKPRSKEQKDIEFILGFTADFTEGDTLIKAKAIFTFNVETRKLVFKLTYSSNRDINLKLVLEGDNNLSIDNNLRSKLPYCFEEIVTLF